MIKLIIFVLVLPNVFAAHKFTGVDLRTKKEVSVASKDDKPVVLYFLSSSCPCVQAHFDHLNSLQKEYKDIQFVGFHSNKYAGINKSSRYFEKFKIDFPIIHDQKLTYANKYKAVKTPHIFILNDDGELLFQGGATNSRDPKRANRFYLKDALSSISKGEDVMIKNAKTLGCYIQR